ncbi:MAG TPA: Holliday junction resolvase RuvX [bacterium]|nr:Holliday junction resolvase RuvX [bacterium]
MRILALDMGTRRIGAALSDPTGTIASALEVIPADSRARVIARVARLVATHDVARVIIGLPIRLDGTEGAEARRARQFAAALQQEIGLPVELLDERLSTAEAERAMLEADASRARRRERRDAVAAALILRRYLDGQRREQEPGNREQAEDHSEGGGPQG